MGQLEQRLKNRLSVIECRLATLSLGILEAMKFSRVAATEADVFLFNIHWLTWAADHPVSDECRDLFSAGQNIRHSLILMSNELLLSSRARIRHNASTIISRASVSDECFTPWKHATEGVTNEMLSRLILVTATGAWYCLREGLIDGDIARVLVFSPEVVDWCRSVRNKLLLKVIRTGIRNASDAGDVMYPLISSAMVQAPYRWTLFDPTISSIRVCDQIPRHYRFPGLWPVE